MNWKTNYEIDKNFSITALIFDAETKKERKYAEKMNRFYRKITEEVKKVTEKDNFPEGGKYYVEIQAFNVENLTDVYISIRLKVKGKTQYAFKEKSSWKNGLIQKPKSIISNPSVHHTNPASQSNNCAFLQKNP